MTQCDACGAVDAQGKISEPCYMGCPGMMQVEAEADVTPSDRPPAPADQVKHPPHYARLVPEPLDVIEAWEGAGAIGHHEACALKYIARARLKGRHVEDLRKASEYLRRRIAQLEGAC